ncbi:MAG: hypothetical protein ABSG53_14660 [Thermoguttaceae bacterium]
MEPTTRTPEGEPNRCPVCGKRLQIEPSRPPGDAPCPHCGSLLWFGPSVPVNSAAIRGERGEKLFEVGTKRASEGNFDIATELFAACVQLDPGNVIYVQNLICNLHKKYGNKEKIGPLSRFGQRGARSAFKDAISHGRWDEALKEGWSVLMGDPWDFMTLAAMATAYRRLADVGGGRDYSRFAECSLFCSKCAADASL